ncbi:MAG: TonB-dependent receptor [Flavobacteriales bacterium]|nr:TonB-dependent receptor [Bacteroidota bacterium]MCB9240700.1 TonB-dependent receptor [Flavobacteriales bacterium]
MNIRNSLLLVLFVALIGSTLCAQQVVFTLVDRTTNLPIEHVEVVIISPNKSTSDPVARYITNSSGKLTANVSSSQRYTVITHHISYETDTFYWHNQNPFVIQLTPTTEKMEEALITAVRPSKEVPSTTTLVTKEEIDRVNFGQDMPVLLSQTPSTVTSSDAGSGVGYTGIRIRGIDPTRVNVTINGIPLNDAESHGVYWVDLPDFASSSNSIQIQRGVGTSTNGAGAFGASINIKSDHVERNPFVVADVGYGSFNTRRISIQQGTGVSKTGWGLQSRLSLIQSDGFIDRASSDLRSLFLTAAHYGKRDLLKFNVILGHERTYQAWYGVPQPYFNQDKDGTEAFMNELYFTPEDRDHLYASKYNRYNPYTYENEVDNYDQHHFQGFYNRRLKGGIHLNTGLHYTKGFGYYEQYRPDDEFATYGWDTVMLGGDTIRSGDFIRRRWLDNDFYGMIFSLNIPVDHINLIAGGGVHRYIGRHCGEVIWAQFGSDGFLGDRYYNQDARKDDANLYLKLTTNYQDHLFFYGDMQVRTVTYDLDMVSGHLNEQLTFFNPKAGATYGWGAKRNHTAHIMLAVANREPVRDDYVSAPNSFKLRHENLRNLEVGNEWQFRKVTGRINGYYMYYRYQLVLTGEINDVGDYIRTNVPKSYRAGVETEVAYEPNSSWRITANATFSQNKIVEFTEYVDDWSTGDQVAFDHVKSDLAFSPALIGFASIEYRVKPQINLNLNGKYVSQQYLDNSQSAERSLPAFYVTNFTASKDWVLKKGTQISLGLQVNNLLDVDYAPNGYTFGTMDAGVRKSYNYVYPMAGRHGMIRLKVKI